MRPTSDDEKKAKGTFYNHNKLAAERAQQEKVDAAQRSAIPVPAGMEVAPKFLTREEKAHWNEFIMPLIKIGFISMSDIPAAIYYVTVWCEFMEYMKARSSKAKMAKMPAKAQLLGAAAYSDTVRKALNDLGFTPRTRRAVAMVVKEVKPDAPKNDPWARALGSTMYDASRGHGEFAQPDQPEEYLTRAKPEGHA